MAKKPHIVKYQTTDGKDHEVKITDTKLKRINKIYTSNTQALDELIGILNVINEDHVSSIYYAILADGLLPEVTKLANENGTYALRLKDGKVLTLSHSEAEWIISKQKETKKPIGDDEKEDDEVSCWVGISILVSFGVALIAALSYFNII